MFKQQDIIDYALIAGFLGTLGTMLYMLGVGKEIPELLQTIFWSLAVGLGLKKYPTK